MRCGLSWLRWNIISFICYNHDILMIDSWLQIIFREHIVFTSFFHLFNPDVGSILLKISYCFFKLFSSFKEYKNQHGLIVHRIRFHQKQSFPFNFLSFSFQYASLHFVFTIVSQKNTRYLINVFLFLSNDYIGWLIPS